MGSARQKETIKCLNDDNNFKYCPHRKGKATKNCSYSPKTRRDMMPCMKEIYNYQNNKYER